MNDQISLDHTKHDIAPLYIKGLLHQTIEPDAKGKTMSQVRRVIVADCRFFVVKVRPLYHMEPVLLRIDLVQKDKMLADLDYVCPEQT